MSHFPYTSPRLLNDPVLQWADWLEDGSWREEYVALVPTGLIDNHPWSPQRLENLEAVFARGDKLPPVQLSKSNGRYSVGDGNHRVELSKIHGLTQVPAILVREHQERPSKEPPSGLAQEVSTRELLKLIAVLRRKNPLLAQYGEKSVSRDGKVWLIWIEVEDLNQYVKGTIAIKRSGNNYTLLAKWQDDNKTQRFSAQGYDEIAAAVWDWIEQRSQMRNRQGAKRIPEKNRHGDCYSAAGKYILDHPHKPDLFFLVHGIVTGQGPIAGIKYGHAWVEEGDLVIEVSNGRNLRLPKAVYYALGQIEKTIRYSATEAVKKMLSSHHFGPWDLKSRY
jgi:hypothetical protein